MINYIFKNTNYSIALLVLKACRMLAKEGKSFRIIFDKEYDIFLQDCLVSDSFYVASDRHIYSKHVINGENILLDFDLDFSISNFRLYEEYISFKLFGKINELDQVNLTATVSQEIKVEKILEANNQNKFSYVLFAPYNLDILYDEYYTYKNIFYDTSLRSFNSKQVNVINNYLQKRVNLITICPSQDNIDINELAYLVNKCHYVISNLDIVHYLACEYNKPCFINLARFSNYKPKNKNITVYDPERNNKKIIPSSFFKKDFEDSIQYNNTILLNDVDELLQEIKTSLDKNEIAYQE